MSAPSVFQTLNEFQSKLIQRDEQNQMVWEDDRSRLISECNRAKEQNRTLKKELKYLNDKYNHLNKKLESFMNDKRGKVVTDKNKLTKINKANSSIKSKTIGSKEITKGDSTDKDEINDEFDLMKSAEENHMGDVIPAKKNYNYRDHNNNNDDNNDNIDISMNAKYNQENVITNATTTTTTTMTTRSNRTTSTNMYNNMKDHNYNEYDVFEEKENNTPNKWKSTPNVQPSHTTSSSSSSSSSNSSSSSSRCNNNNSSNAKVSSISDHDTHTTSSSSASIIKDTSIMKVTTTPKTISKLQINTKTMADNETIITTTTTTPSPPSRKKIKYHETTRNQNERATLPGHICNECQRYYEALQQQGIVFTTMELQTLLKSCSRHKSEWSPPHTPTGFWDLSVHTPTHWKD